MPEVDNVPPVRGDVVLSGARWGLPAPRFESPKQILVAERPGEVVSVIESVEAAARSGAWVAGFVAYDAAPGFDSRLRVPPGGVAPLVWFGVFDDPKPRPDISSSMFSLDSWTAGWTAAEHEQRVGSIQSAIRSGDTYQVNLTFPMTAVFAGSPLGLLAVMQDAQPGSYGALIDLGDRQVVSVSPELYLQIDGHHLRTVPMKGTAPRGRSSAEDWRRARQLISSEKEKAGNVMIVDLLRNDLGRIADVGSVEVTSLYETERHPTVWQLTSTVEAVARPDTSLVDVFRSAFPSGSVTGAPKVSTMGLIADLESHPRGPYCGAVGYLAPGGEHGMFSVGIRTGVVADSRFEYHVGGGITHDSIASDEYDECLWKALVVTRSFDPPALLETMLWQPGVGIALLDRHVDRLASSADYWSIDLDMELLGDALSAVQGHGPLRVRLVLETDGRIEVETESVAGADEPVGLRTWEGRVDQSDPSWAHKKADRTQYPDGAEGEELVMTNLDGLVTETNISNVFALIDGKWLTPPVGDGCLPGVFRETVLEEGEAVERSLAPVDIAHAEELAVTNALQGWRKAVLIE